MWIQHLTLINFRSFAKAELTFSKQINLLVGANNSGKSSILLPLLGLQEGLPHPTPQDMRIGTNNSRAEIILADPDGTKWDNKYDRVLHEYRPQNKDFPLHGHINYKNNLIGKIPDKEPRNFIYPFVSKRKVTELREQVNNQTVEAIPSTFENLNAKIDRIMNPEFLPSHEMYMRACDNILGFRVTTAHTGQGKRAVYTVQNMSNIPLLAMGEGVMNILGLVVHLAIAKNNLFLIEEPENDVHPKALKALLDLIIEKSSDNQFIITTHSNIVLKRLGSSPGTKVFKITSTLQDRLPTSTVGEIGPTPDERRTILSELGYEMFDDDIWTGWLFLEESSAEKIIREYLIPWFCPELRGRLRTFSAHSVSEVTPKFRDFNDLFVFLHLEPVYKNRAWVVIDAGTDETAVIEGLRNMYTRTGWNEGQFQQFSKHNFEEYYPNDFIEDIRRIQVIQNKTERRSAKKIVLEKIEHWIAEDITRAKTEFAKSAADVIALLKMISEKLK